MTHKDFTAARAEQVGDPISFTLAGETFHCAPAGAVPAGVLSDLLFAPDYDKLAELDARTVQLLTNATIEFIQACLGSNEDRNRWYRLTHRPYEPERRDEHGQVVDPGWMPIRLEDVAGVSEWLVEVYTGRPTQPAVDSSAPSSPTGPSSTAGGSPVQAQLGPPPVDLAAAAAAAQARAVQETAGSTAAAAVEHIASSPTAPAAQAPVGSGGSQAGSPQPAAPSTSQPGS